MSWVRLRVREREGETQGSASDGGLGFVDADSSLLTNACKPNSKSVNQTHCLLLHIKTVQSVCVCVCVCVCFTSSRFRPWKGQTFCKNKTRSSRFWKRINRWEGNGEEGRTEEGDSERVEVREGGECVGSRGSLRVESGLRVFWDQELRVFFNCVELR